MSKKIPVKLIDAETAKLWKNETINRLKAMGEVPEEMERRLLQVLRPNYKPKGHLLLEPGVKHNEMIYVKTGLIKLFIIEPVTGTEQILYIWKENEFLMMYNLFRKRLENTKYYIKVVEDAELVSINNDYMDEIYNDYPFTNLMTIDILSIKDERKRKQLEILGTMDKTYRPVLFEMLFSEFYNRLNNSDKCAFIGVGETTLFRANHE